MNKAILKKKFNEGILALEKNELDIALNKFELILKYKKKEPKILNLISICYLGLGNLDSAKKFIKKAILFQPDEVGFQINLGNLLKQQKKYKESELVFKNIIKIFPNSSIAFYNLGLLYSEQYNYDQSLYFYKESLKIDSTNKYTLNNVGMVLRAMNQLDEAITQYNCAINIDPSFCLAHFNLSQIMLLRKLNHDGWKKYEYRDSKKNFRNKILKNLNIPEWNKEDLTNKKLIIYSEQGIGDSVQFLRYIKAISKHNTKIFLYTNKNLCYLFSNVAEIDSLIFEDKDVPFCDFYISLMSLPFIFKNLKNIPTTYNFFPKNINLDNSWKKIIKLNKKIQIGLSWQGSADNKEDYKRSVSLLIFSPFFEIKNLAFTSLQKNYGQEQITQFNLEGKIVNFYKNKIVGSNNKFEDTISIIKNMDLVITVDTAVAHISATLGKETWILLPLVNDFRWGTKNEKTVWYKNVKLFRQTKINQWQDVVIKIKKNLEKLIDKKTTDKI